MLSVVSNREVVIPWSLAQSGSVADATPFGIDQS